MKLLAYLFLASLCCYSADYYIEPGGSDSNPGSSAQPWASTDVFWRRCFQPGDRIHLRGEATFRGRIYLNLNCSSQGTSASPIVVTSFGTGRAIVEGGFEAHDKAGIELRNLVFRSPLTANTLDGVAFYGTDHANIQRSYLRIEGIEVSGFGGFGIAVGPWWEDTGGYSDVRIVRCSSHDNRKGGIVTYGTGAGKLYVNKNVYVGDSEAYNSTGYRLSNFPAGWRPEGTGNGILLGSVDGGVIERCKAYNNGAQNDYIDGPVGIMIYDSRNVVIQNNESYANKTLVNDGNGFSMDRNTSNSVLQNNWSHDNDGVGLYVAQNVDQPYNFGNKVSYNLSQNDARKGRYAAISIWGPMRDIEINHNRVIVGASTQGKPVAVALSNAFLPGTYVHNVSFHDNVFQTSGGVPLLFVDSGLLSGSTGVAFRGNWYQSDKWQVTWGSRLYTSLPAFRTGTGQEILKF